MSFKHCVKNHYPKGCGVFHVHLMVLKNMHRKKEIESHIIQQKTHVERQKACMACLKKFLILGMEKKLRTKLRSSYCHWVPLPIKCPTCYGFYNKVKTLVGKEWSPDIWDRIFVQTCSKALKIIGERVTDILEDFCGPVLCRLEIMVENAVVELGYLILLWMKGSQSARGQVTVLNHMWQGECNYYNEPQW